jgi:hypothetical protein
MDDKQLALRQGLQVALQHVASRSVALVFYPDPAGQPQDVGAGTCIQLGDRYFVATAGHNLLTADGTEIPKEQLLIVHADSPSRAQTRWEPIVRMGRRGGGKGEPLDLGWLEIPASVALKMGKVFLQRTDLELNWHTLGHGAVTFGYPTQFIDRQVFAAEGRLQVSGIAFPGKLLPDEGWPKTADAGSDVIIEFWNQGWFMHKPDEVFTLAVPRGLSGGGIWALNFKGTLVWSPGDIRLAAVQHSAVEGSYLRGNQIGAWLRMIAEDLPELSSIAQP